MAASRIAFLGLGAMGGPMARRLLDGGHVVASCVNRRREPIDALLPHGLVEAPTPREAAMGAAAVLTMVRDAAETRAVLQGENGALAGLAPGAAVIVMSTIDPDFSRNLAQEVAPRGLEVIDCPVSGFPFKAAEGTLALMAGGSKDAIERHRPMLERMGRIFHCGDVGMGTVAKLANNLMAVGTNRLLTEAIAFAGAYGLPQDALLEIMKSASGDSFIVRNWPAIETMREHVLRMGRKDVKLYLDAAAARPVGTLLADATVASIDKSG